MLTSWKKRVKYSQNIKSSDDDRGNGNWVTWEERLEMKYRCVDHLDKFYFRDARMQKCGYRDGQMTWTLTGAVARYNLPVNETMTDRYIDTAQIRFKGAAITKFFLEGARYYDANDVLQREIPDTDIPEEDYEKIFKLFTNSVIFWVKEKEPSAGGNCCCEVGIDVTDAETEDTSTYWMEIEYEKVVTEWEHFLNKAMVE